MLESKVALIIGADTRIGSAIARRFAYEGAYLILTSENLNALQNLDNEIKNLGGEAMLAQLDMLDLEQVDILYSSIQNKFKRLDILVTSNIYTGKPNLIVDYAHEEIRKVINMNFYINWYMMKCFDPLFKLSDSARIIFTTIETFSKKENLYFSPFFSIQSGLQKLLKDYTKQNSHSHIKANIISVENYEDTSETSISKYFTDTFVRLASEKCTISGRKHYVQCQ